MADLDQKKTTDNFDKEFSLNKKKNTAARGKMPSWIMILAGAAVITGVVAARQPLLRPTENGTRSSVQMPASTAITAEKAGFTGLNDEKADASELEAFFGVQTSFDGNGVDMPVVFSANDRPYNIDIKPLELDEKGYVVPPEDEESDAAIYWIDEKPYSVSLIPADPFGKNAEPNNGDQGYWIDGKQYTVRLEPVPEKELSGLSKTELSSVVRLDDQTYRLSIDPAGSEPKKADLPEEAGKSTAEDKIPEKPETGKAEAAAPDEEPFPEAVDSAGELPSAASEDQTVIARINDKAYEVTVKPYTGEKETGNAAASQNKTGAATVSAPQADTGAAAAVKADDKAGAPAASQNKAETGAAAAVKEDDKAGALVASQNKADTGAAAAVKEDDKAGASVASQNKAETGAAAAIKEDDKAGAPAPSQNKAETGAASAVKEDDKAGAPAASQNKADTGAAAASPSEDKTGNTSVSQNENGTEAADTEHSSDADNKGAQSSAGPSKQSSPIIPVTILEDEVKPEVKPEPEPEPEPREEKPVQSVVFEVEGNQYEILLKELYPEDIPEKEAGSPVVWIDKTPLQLELSDETRTDTADASENESRLQVKLNPVPEEQLPELLTSRFGEAEAEAMLAAEAAETVPEPEETAVPEPEEPEPVITDENEDGWFVNLFHNIFGSNPTEIPTPQVTVIAMTATPVPPRPTATPIVVDIAQKEEVTDQGPVRLDVPVGKAETVVVTKDEESVEENYLDDAPLWDGERSETDNPEPETGDTQELIETAADPETVQTVEEGPSAEEIRRAPGADSVRIEPEIVSTPEELPHTGMAEGWNIPSMLALFAGLLLLIIGIRRLRSSRE